jgi:hypothetical protein
LQSVERQTGRAPEELVGPELPPAAEGIWMAFLELAGRRHVSGFGASALTYGDLDAWARLTGRRVSPLEVRLLTRLDDTWLASVQPKATP